jgi:hypothetical protein
VHVITLTTSLNSDSASLQKSQESGQQATIHVRVNATVYTLDTGKVTTHTARLVSTVATPKQLLPVDGHQHLEDSQELYEAWQVDNAIVVCVPVLYKFYLFICTLVRWDGKT